MHPRGTDVAGEDRVHNLEVDLTVPGVLGPEGEAVHRGVCETRRWFAREYDTRGPQSEGGPQVDVLGRERPKILEDELSGFFVRDHRMALVWHFIRDSLVIGLE